jgi:hypothetical protein
MVSNEEGVRLRKLEEVRQENIKQTLAGAKITDVQFSGCGINNHAIKELTVEKDGVLFTIEIEAEQYYECITSQLIITNTQTMKEVK